MPPTPPPPSRMSRALGARKLPPPQTMTLATPLITFSTLLNNGVTMAVFQRDGNFPVENDMLIIRVILGATAGAAIRRRRAPILSMPDD